MKPWLYSNLKKPETILLIIFALVAFLLHAYKFYLPCLNADEAAFGYNAYSITTTAKDEYGKSLPLRFKSFGENKLPILIYLTTPFIKIFGLNEISIRIVPALFGILSPLTFYFFVLALFQNKKIAIIASFLSSLSPWIQITSRHVHEAPLVYTFITLSLISFWKLEHSYRLKFAIISSVINLIALLTYHLAKIFTFFFVIWLIVKIIRNSQRRIFFIKSLVIFMTATIIFIVSEIAQPTNRISNLLLYNTPGFTSSIEELRKEHNSRLIHNKITKAGRQLVFQYLSYFSPEFLLVQGDKNPRFGYPGISPITPIEYIFVLIGICYLYRNKEKSRYFLTSILVFSPLSAALSWQQASLTRSFFLIVPLVTLAAYGGYYFLIQLKKIKFLVITTIVVAYFLFIFFSWEYYFFHYFKKPEVLTAWQCGYKEVMQWVNKNYSKYDYFYLTKKAGQPYIFALFYLSYPPALYQPQSKLSSLDEYGFGQVEKFDKFIFTFKYPLPTKNSALVGTPDDFHNLDIHNNKITIIQNNDTPLFYILDNLQR